jgi:dienelactone hydrolase
VSPAGGDRLEVRRLPRRSRGAVLFLHGGYDSDLRPPSALLNAPALRMTPFVRALLRSTRGDGGSVAVARVRYRHRGWNGARADAAADALDGLAALRALTGDAPTVLVGHSMGGRAALRAAGRPGVAGVVALAPWCPPEEPPVPVAGARLVFAHAAADRVTSPAGSRQAAVRARAAGARVARYELPGGDHAMLRQARVWHTLTLRATRALLGLDPLPHDLAAAFAEPPGSGAGLDLPPHAATGAEP